MTSANVRVDVARMRRAADLRWEDPGRSWEKIAQTMQVSERQLRRWRETEAWQICLREAGNEYVERLAPAAVSALLRAWAKGNPHGAVEVLRSFGFLRNEKVEMTADVTHHASADALDEQIARLLAVRLIAPALGEGTAAVAAASTNGSAHP